MGTNKVSSADRHPKVRVGVDIGGTFTDIAMQVGNEIVSGKVLTDPAFPECALVDGIEQVAGKAGLCISDIVAVIHGTTLVTNALIERRGAKTAFITTDGFRDVIEMRTENRFEQYDLNLVLPKPLIARQHRFTVTERIGAQGQELRPIDDDNLQAAVNLIVAGGYESVAVGLIHSYLNPAHEQRIAAALHTANRALSISISSDVSPQPREYERFNTVCANAFVKPLVSAYLERLTNRLAETGIRCPVFMMHSGGGLLSIESAAKFPVRLLESGPAGGAVYAASFARRHAAKKTLSYDMGGTTAKICLIENYKPKTTNSFEVARTYRFKKGSGMPVSIPSIEMVEIGAGGGSIAHVDALSQVRVGPESAGSVPGPACYQRSGTQPTVTDANLVLGRLDPDHFAGGSIPLSREKAEAAGRHHIGNHLNLTQEATAFAICEIVDENMANAARVHAVESGKDVRDFTLVAFGGAAPLHACRMCEKLAIDMAIIPPDAGVGSAIGFLKAPIAYQSVRGAYMRLSRFDPARANTVLRDMQDEAKSFVRQGSKTASLETVVRVFMRYVGQGWELPVEIKPRRFTARDSETFAQLYEDAYSSHFGRTIKGLDIEIVNWAVGVSSPLAPVNPVDPVDAGRPAPVQGTREMFDAQLRTSVQAQVVSRSAMARGDMVAGPAIIIEDQTSTIVTSTFDAVMQADGSLFLLRRDGRSTDGRGPSA